MAVRTRGHATYDDVINAPEDKIAELIDGELFLSHWQTPRHSNLLTEIAAHLRLRFGKTLGAWLILLRPEVHLDHDVFVPDVVGWRRETLSLTGDEPFRAEPFEELEIVLDVQWPSPPS